MKTRIFATLFFATFFTLHAPAQQASSNPQSAASADQTGSGNATASGQEPLRTIRGDFWDGDEPGLAWLVLHPFASKAYVRRTIQPIQDRLKELDELTASQSTTAQGIGTHSQRGIQLASEKANEADEHATDATNKARAAQETATKVNTHLNTIEGVVGNIDPSKATNQTEIHFRFGRYVLNEESKHALDALATPLKDGHGYVIEVQGFSKGRGQAAVAASRQMADSVVRYLVADDKIPAYRIYAIGMGNTSVTSDQGTAPKRTESRRVEVKVLKNDLDQLASSSGSEGK